MGELNKALEIYKKLVESTKADPETAKILARGGLKKEVLRSGAVLETETSGGLLAKTYELTGKRDILDQRIPWPIRRSLAMDSLREYISKNSPKGSSTQVKEVSVKNSQTAQAVTAILADPTKYGLDSLEDADKIAEAAWYIAGATDSADIDNATDIERSIVKRKSEEIRAKYSEGSLKAVHEIRNLKITQEDISLEKRQRIIAYYQAQSEDEKWSKSQSNSKGDLRDLEYGIIALAQGAAGAKAEVLTQHIKGLNTKLEGVKGVLGKANGVYEIYKNPEGFLASKLAKKLGVETVSKAVGQKVASALIAKAAGTALAAAMGTVAPIIGNIVGYVAGDLMVKSLRRTINGVKKGAKVAVAAAGGLATALFLGLPSGALAAATSSVVSIVILAPIVAFIMLIINSGGYMVPPGSGRISTGPVADVGPFPVGNNCVIPNVVLRTTSYRGAEVGGHGSNVYWRNISEVTSLGRYWENPANPYWIRETPNVTEVFACRWSIPDLDVRTYARAEALKPGTMSTPLRLATTCQFNNDPQSVCFDPASRSRCRSYGYAADWTYPNADSLTNLPVFYPYIDTNNDGVGDPVVWQLKPEYSGLFNGHYAHLQTVANGTTYDMMVSHLSAIPTGGASGQVMGTLDDSIPGKHIHVELRIDGAFVKPEEYMCTISGITQ